MSSEIWHKTVEPGDAEAVKASILMGSGELNIGDGTEALLEGTFSYAMPEWQPDVTYAVEDGRGDLVVRPPQERRASLGDPRYIWDLRLGHSVPVDLGVQLGSGRAALNLRGTPLLKLDAKVGSGSVSADVSGDHNELEQIGLSSGSGRLGLSLSGDFPALNAVDLRNASGVTDVSLGGTYTALTRVRLTSASGDINLGVAGALPKLDRLDVKVASGVVDLNFLEAAWESLDVAVDCVSGKATVRYPRGVGVFVRFSSVTGRLDAPGLSSVPGGYATPNYEEAATKISLSMSTVSGLLTLQPAGV